MTDLAEILAKIVSCDDDSDYGGLCDLDGGAPGENAPYQSERLHKVLEKARAALKQ